MSVSQAKGPLHHVLTDAVRAQIMEIFVEEGEELVAYVERHIDSIAAGAENPSALWLEVQRALHTLKGSCAAAGAESASSKTHALEARIAVLCARDVLPTDSEVHALFDALSDLRRAVAEVGAPRADAGAQNESELEPALPSALDPEVTLGAPARTKSSELLRVRPERIDALDALVSELVLVRLQNRALLDRIKELRTHTERSMQAYRDLDARLRQRSRALGPTVLRGVEAASRALGTELLELGRDAHALSRQAPLVNAQAVAVSTSLEDGIRELRLMPLAPFFDEYASVVREAARECGKSVRLEVRAEGAEIDRAVLLKLREPLLHLSRNAVVHGLESTEERTLRGKPAHGCVFLDASCEGTRAVLRIRDDGRGIDVRKVLGKAQELGLTIDGDLSSKKALLDILTHPGFSTRDHADHLAGRGMGLDIVASVVDELDGKLSLTHEPGYGSCFSIEVPITAATSRGLVVRVGGQFFAVMLNRVERVLRLGWDDIGQLEGCPTVRIGDEVLSVAELSRLLSVRGDAEGTKVQGLVLRHGRQRLVVLVDDVAGEQALVIRPFPPALAGSELFLGGAVQVDGAVLPVVNVDALFLQAGARQVSFDRPAQPANDNERHVLVVDDSITMRTLLRNILTAAGYSVVVASDGVQALGQLDEMRQCDVVITDLQMPNLDGVDLCRAIRARKGPYVPVVMVTSVGDGRERKRAIDAGADAYVVKAEFEQSGFLERVRGLVGAPIGKAS